MLQPGDNYHVGFVADDFDGALAWLTDTAGYRWCEELAVSNVVVTAEWERTLLLRLTYSMDAPHLEVVQSVPGTPFVSSPGAHHVGYWSDDVDADAAALEARGAVVEAKGLWSAGGMAVWAFVQPPKGPRIELVNRAARPSMERWFATGVRP